VSILVGGGSSFWCVGMTGGGGENAFIFDDLETTFDVDIMEETTTA